MFKDHFSSHAAHYATYRPVYPPVLATWLASVAPATRTALDVGCGSGQLTRLLAEHFDEVIAIDPSAQQIAGAAAHPRIDYRVAAAEASGLPDRSIDLLTAAQAAHWFDLPTFFAEARRLLVPGGVVALVTYAEMEVRGPIEAIVDRFRGETLAGHWPPERAMVDDHYRGIALPFEPISAPSMAIDVCWPLAALIGYLDTWSAVRALERQAGRGAFDAVVDELSSKWGDPAEPRSFRWPLTILAGRA